MHKYLNQFGYVKCNLITFQPPSFNASIDIVEIDANLHFWILVANIKHDTCGFLLGVQLNVIEVHAFLYAECQTTLRVEMQELYANPIFAP